MFFMGKYIFFYSILLEAYHDSMSSISCKNYPTFKKWKLSPIDEYNHIIHSAILFCLKPKIKKIIVFH